MDPLNKEEIGLRIKQIRSGVPLVQWAEQLQCSKTAISQYETGKSLPGPEFLVQLWLHYRTDPIRLLTGTNNTTDALGEQISLSDDETAMVKTFRSCTPAGRETVKQVLALARRATLEELATDLSSLIDPATGKYRVGSETQQRDGISVRIGDMTNEGSGGVQVGFAGGNVRVKKGS